MTKELAEDKDLSKRDQLILKILLKLEESNQETVRMLDSSLYQLAFAYIGAFALCVPAIFVASANIATLKNHLWLMAFVLCQIAFLGGFYALMLVRGRNTHLAHVAYATGRINDMIKDNYGEKHKIFFEHSYEMSRLYLGGDNGAKWFAMYLLFLVPIVLACGYTIRATWVVSPILMFVVVAEIIITFIIYFASLKTVGLKSAKEMVEHDIDQYLEKLDSGQNTDITVQ